MGIQSPKGLRLLGANEGALMDKGEFVRCSLLLLTDLNSD